jgi:nucleotide-binding universal stress UspA family protein
MDGSTLAECVLPHVVALATAMGARVTLLHVLETPHEKHGTQAVDPVDWHLKKREAHDYLDQVANQLKDAHLAIEKVILEGTPADRIIDYMCSHDVDLIVLSTHGQSGLTGWNISSVGQKIILRCYKSMFLVRAYRPSSSDVSEVRYQHLFVGLDCSARADYVLPFAIRLAQYYKARLTLGTVVQRPTLLQRTPLSKADVALVNGLVEKNRQWATHYLQQLQTQFSMEGMDCKPGWWLAITRLLRCTIW